MKKKRNIIIIVATIGIIIILIIANIAKKDNISKEEMNKIYSEVKENNEDVKDEKPIRTNRINTYVTVEETIKNYIENTKNQNVELVMSVLNKEYISKNNINSNNLSSSTQQYKNITSYKNIEMYEQNSERFTAYYIKGQINDQGNVYFEIGVDVNNHTYDIMPITENEYTTKINQSTGERTIEKNENNSIEFKDYDNADIAKMYFDDYLKQMISNPEKAYNLLDKQYRETKFGNYNGFVQYINANREKLELTYKMETLDNNDFEKYSDYLDFKLQHSNLGIKKYSIETYENYVQYTCQDAEGNYYIFSAQYPMDYSVVLDVYTTDTPYFKNMYSRSTDQNKAKLNLEKIQEALNNKDYKYIYNKLNATFKANNFATESQFESYMKNNFFDKNQITYNIVEKQGDAWLFNAKLNNANGKEQKGINLVVKLNEGTEFEMSFSIK